MVRRMVAMTGPSQDRASDTIAAELRRMIVNHDLPPAAIVSEAYLMELLSCGRTPLREALHVLAQEHLIVSVPKLGISITGLSVVDWVEVVECLEALTAAVMRLAAERINATQLARLKEIIAEAEVACQTRDLSTLTELDTQFHEVIGEAAGSRYLAQYSNHVTRLGIRFALVAYKRGADLNAPWDEHRQIVAILEAHDPQAAERVAHEVTAHSRDRIRATLI